MTEEKADMQWHDPEQAKEHLATYDAFMKLTKYGTIGVILIVIFMAVTLL